MNFAITNKIDINKWKSLLLNSPQSSVFQTPDFLYFLNSNPGLSAEVFAVEIYDEYSVLVALTQQQEQGIAGYFSGRAIIYGGVLLNENILDSFAFENLLSKITCALKGKVIYCEIRNSFDYSKFRTVFENNKWKYIPHLNVKLNLQGKTYMEILAGMKYNRRREIKLSLNEGAIVRVAKDFQEVNALYSILKDLYKEKVRLPLPSIEYFNNIFTSPIGKIFVVIHDGKIIGGSFCLFSPGSSIYTLYYAGVRDYHKKIFPTHLAIWGAILFGIDNNLKMLDFMGAGVPNKPYGVRDYKLEFGGELVEHGRFIKIFNPFLYLIGKLGIKILSKFRR